MSLIINPVVRLKPKTSQVPIKTTYPWVYNNEMLLDYRTTAIKVGQIVQVQLAGRIPIKAKAFYASSKFNLRIISLNPNHKVDPTWITSKIKAAFDLCKREFKEGLYWLVLAEANGLPLVIFYRFGNICVIQPNAAWAGRHFDVIREAIEAFAPINKLIKNISSHARKFEKLESESVLTKGTCSNSSIPASMNGGI